ncbi:hypothetical protein [Xanthomonas phage JGB6]|nr:hypothetical protein [Xanthomonas phage JGB6]
MASEKLSNDILAGREQGIVSIAGKGGKSKEEKLAERQATALENFYESLKAKNASLKASVEDGIPSLEKFNSLLKDGKWGNANEGMVAGIRALMKANDDLADSIKKNKATEKLADNLSDMEAKAKADVVSAR